MSISEGAVRVILRVLSGQVDVDWIEFSFAN